MAGMFDGINPPGAEIFHPRSELPFRADDDFAMILDGVVKFKFLLRNG
jgi:hypothetical protein